MAQFIAVRVKGLRETVANLEALGVAVDDLKAVFGGIAQDASAIAARHAPSRTGRLRASIRGSKAKNKAVVRAGRSLVPYAGPINFGWPKRNIEPSLFMQRASAEIAPSLEPRVERELNRLFSQHGG